MSSAFLAQGRQNKGKDNLWLWEMSDFTYLALQKKTLRPITLIEDNFIQHLTSDNRQHLGWQGSIFTITDFWCISAALFLLSMISYNILVNHIILHNLRQNTNYKRQVDLPSGSPTANGSNFSDLNDKNIMCFTVPTALHHPYSLRLVSHAVSSETAFPYQSGHRITWIGIRFIKGKTEYFLCKKDV